MNVHDDDRRNVFEWLAMLTEPMGVIAARVLHMDTDVPYPEEILETAADFERIAELAIRAAKAYRRFAAVIEAEL